MLFDPDIAATLLIERAKRRAGATTSPRDDPAEHLSRDAKLDHLHRLIVHSGHLRVAVESLETDIGRHGAPTDAALRALVLALTDLAGQGTLLSLDIGHAIDALLPPHPNGATESAEALTDDVETTDLTVDYGQTGLPVDTDFSRYQPYSPDLPALPAIDYGGYGSYQGGEPDPYPAQGSEWAGAYPYPPPNRVEPVSGGASPQGSAPTPDPAPATPDWVLSQASTGAQPATPGRLARLFRNTFGKKKGHPPPDPATQVWPQWRGTSGPSELDTTARFLVADLPDRAPLLADVSLLVWIRAEVAGPATASAPLDRLIVPQSGAMVSVLVQTPAGLMSVNGLEQTLWVPPYGDTEPVRFAFRARLPGLHRVRVLAFVGGTFLAELQVEVSVEPGGPSVAGEPVVAPVADMRARQGEVTLQIRSDQHGTVFQLLSDNYLFEPVLVQAAAGDPSSAVERAIDTLKQLAQGRGPYAGTMARRWMRETGIGLWNGVVPATIKEQYWQLRDNITSFTIATTHDVIPWELLHPLRPGSDDGFMVEQFPVLRRVFGQHRADRVTISPCTGVVSGRAPANARQEIASVAGMLGSGGVVEDLGELLDLIESTPRGSLHFACHNSFSTDGGSSIAMAGGPFVPGLLHSAATRQSLASTNPLVFLNACRTAGSVPEYHQMIGWAQQFMSAGAGAFVGTLWPVRSDSASVFAETFYTRLLGGDPLGQAVLHARRTAVGDDPDPTWLAYTVYGDPRAHAN